MQNDLNLYKTRVNDFVKLIVRSVADNYIASNGLMYLKRPEQKLVVARSVFRELDKSTSLPGEPFFPLFDDIDVDVVRSISIGVEKVEFEPLRSIANSLVDINVESSSGNLAFVSKDIPFSLSISPALVIVLANLVNSDSQILWDWEGFESIVMLSEMKRMIVQTKTIPSCLDRLVFKLQSPLPGTNAQERFAVPVVGNFTVILNRRLAGYADVVAPYRLVQCKHSVDDSKTIDLDVQKELDKLGLTSTSALKQFLTDVFYNKIWCSLVDAPAPFINTIVMSTKRAYRHECFPFDILNSRRIVEEGVFLVGELLKDSDGHFLKDSGFCLTENGIRQFCSSPITFQKERPVAAVFATNCNAFRLTRGKTTKKATVGDAGKVGSARIKPVANADTSDPLQNNKQASESTDAAKGETAKNPMEIVISPSDVDCYGELLDASKIPSDFISGLRENVNIRFLFFGWH